MPLNIPTLKRKPNEEEDVLTKQRNEAMLHMARLAYERMRRIDEEDHERGMKEQQYNNSVKYQRMVEYELNNPGETATGVLEYEAIFKRSRGKRVKRRLLREAVANGEMEHVPRSLRPKKRVLRKPDPSKIVYNRFTPAVQREMIDRELTSKSTLTDLVLGMIPGSKSRGKKAVAVKRGRKFEREYGSAGSRGQLYGEGGRETSFPDFRGYELGDEWYETFPQMQGPSAHIRSSIHDTYDGYEDYRTSATFAQPQYAYEYPGSRASFAYGEGLSREAGVGYDERSRRFSAPVPNFDPYPGFQPQQREATSLPDIRANASVEEQIEELLEAMERSSLAESDFSGSLDEASEEVERQIAEIKAGKRKADAVIECVALEDLPPVIQTIAIAREDARLEFEDEMGFEIEEIGNVAPILVDLFELAKVLAQETL